MAQKIECDRCGALVDGVIDQVPPTSTRNGQDSGKAPSVVNWAFVRPPRIEGKTWRTDATLLCPACVELLIAWLVKSKPKTPGKQGKRFSRVAPKTNLIPEDLPETKEERLKRLGF